MSEVTFNGLRDSLTEAIETAFPGVPIVAEDSTATPPYMVVSMPQGSQTMELGRCYRRSQSFDIRYYGSDVRDLYDAADMLYAALEHIALDDVYCRGTNMRHTVIDGALQFRVDYSFLVRLDEPTAPAMQAMVQEGGLKP